MKNKPKTKAQLRAALDQSQQRVAELEAILAEYHADLEAQGVAGQDSETLPESLYQVYTVLNSTLNYETVLDHILDQAGRVAPYDAACLMLVEGETARVFRWCGYIQQGFDPFFSVPAFKIGDTPILRTVRKSGQPVVISAIKAEDPPLYGFEMPLFKSHLTVPIRSQGELLGFLNLESMIPNFFNQAEANRLQSFARQAATALKNSQLYHQARQEVRERVVALKKERNFVSTILDTAGALVMVLNPRGRILHFNRACEQATGYVIEEVRGKIFWELFLTVDELERVRAVFQSLHADQLTNEYECFWLTKESQKRLIVWTNSVVLDHQDAVEYIVSSGIDITERRQLEERLLAIHCLGQTLNLLRNEVDILEIALKTASSLLPFQSAGYGILEETAGELIYGYRPDYQQPATIELRLPLGTEERTHILQSFRASNNETNESSLQTDSPETSASLWLTAPIKIGDYLIGVLDIERPGPYPFTADEQQLFQTLADQTAIALENARLHEESRQRVAELATMNVIGQAITSTLNLEETLNVVTDHAIRLLGAAAASVVLHDEAGQALTLLMFGLGMLEKEAHDPDAVSSQTAKLKSVTNEVSKNLHRLAVNLRPASLDHSGLEAALRQYVEKFGHQHSLTIQFEAVGMGEQRLPLAVETNLYRIVQEALANIFKHAQATRVDLLLERRGDRIFTIVEDNGVGFDPETAGQTSRLGLLGMRERTEMMGGQLVVESIIGTGTTIYVEVPYVDSHLNR